MIGLFMETYWNWQRRVHKTFIIKFSTIFFSFGFQLSTTFVSLQRIIFYLENDKQERQLYKAGHIEQQAKWCMCTLSCNDPSTMKSLKKKLSDIFTYQWLTEITFFLANRSGWRNKFCSKCSNLKQSEPLRATDPQVPDKYRSPWLYPYMIFKLWLGKLKPTQSLGTT